jgi:hypothetical protein
MRLSANETTFITEVSGIVVGFSARTDGDMRCGTHRRNFARHLGLKPEKIVRSRQVHGSKILNVAEINHRNLSDGDGLLIKRSDWPSAAVVLAADCVPIIIINPRQQVAVTVHAGWRGTVAEIASQAVRALVAAGSDLVDLRVFFGPAIGSCCYTIDQKRAQFFLKNPIIAGAVSGKGTVITADLIGANRQLLQAQGLQADQISSVGVCTACQAVNYYSYRQRDRYPYGENAGLVGFLDYQG